MLDHLVYAVPDLAAAVKEFERRSGVRPALGGKHEGLGTHNALVALGRAAYLELIAPDPEQDQPQVLPFGLRDIERPKLLTWAAKATQLPDRVERARARGCDPGYIIPMSRVEPDGFRMEWSLTFNSELTDEGLVPFLIDWSECPNPAKSAPRGCHLREFYGRCPGPEKVRAKLEALGVELDIRKASVTGLVAVLATPRGIITLR